jgi:hypothetical protein
VPKRNLIGLSLLLVILALIAPVTISLNLTINANLSGIRLDSVISNVYAQLDTSSSPEQIREQAKDFLSNLMELRNQSSEDVGVDNRVNNDSETELAEEQFATDINGHYNNSRYGILDFVIPSGWYGSEKQWSGDKSISLDMHPGTEAEYMEKLMSPPSEEGNEEDDIITTMTLESNDKAQLQYTQSLLGEISETGDSSQCESLDGTTRFLEPNSTSTISGKVFDISTTECTYSSDELGTSTTEVLKTYKHESPERVYSLQLKAFKDSFNVNQDSLQNTVDIKKYAPLIDAAIQTLRIE